MTITVLLEGFLQFGMVLAQVQGYTNAVNPPQTLVDFERPLVEKLYEALTEVIRQQTAEAPELSLADVVSALLLVWLNIETRCNASQREGLLLVVSQLPVLLGEVVEQKPQVRH